MEDRPAGALLTIGRLSELTGVPVRTIRFYSDTLVDGAALVRPAARSQAGYRLYDVEAVSRLELIRALRDLGVDLPTVARVLARKVTVAEVARAHAAALEATVKVIRPRALLRPDEFGSGPGGAGGRPGPGRNNSRQPGSCRAPGATAPCPRDGPRSGGRAPGEPRARCGGRGNDVEEKRQ